jgi:hypothetical protein
MLVIDNVDVNYDGETTCHLDQGISGVDIPSLMIQSTTTDWAQDSLFPASEVWDVHNECTSLTML